MENLIIQIMFVVFPVLMYLVFSCYNSLLNKKIGNILFIITMCSSLYLGIEYSKCDIGLLLSNIPILICYLKKERNLAIILSMLVILVGYLKYDINIYVMVIKYISYLLVYIILVKNKNFNYLFLKINAVIQGFFISFEYFINYYMEINNIFYLIFYVSLVYAITFFCLYLFKVADNVSMLYDTINNIKKDNGLKDALFKLTHEIKNPIAVCKGYLDMMNITDIKKSERYIQIIKSEIDRSLNVISDFTEYSKIKINKDIIDLTMLMDDVYSSFEILTSGKNIKFNYNNKYDEIYIMGDYDRLKQVFVNIIKNSIESINDNGIIELSISVVKNKAIVMVSDNGVGMTEEELANIKQMFFTTKKNGTGLGVALSNEIVLAHDGEMLYESIKYEGTKCSVKLPVM